jgi:hypothetical protein
MRALSRRSDAFSLLVALLVASVASACDKDKSEGASSAPPPPPPAASVAKAGACASGGGQDPDAVSAPFFPRVVAIAGSPASSSYCLDPQGEPRAFGEKAKLTLEDVCTSAVDGECEVYKRYGLKRFVSIRYVDGSGAGGSVEIYLSQYNDAPGAYGMFTKRVVADGDPADPSAPKYLAAGGAGAIGTGRAYAWRGDQLAELQYINENESPEQLARSSEAALTPIAQAIGAKLPGPLDKPASAAALPVTHLVGPNAITFFPKDALGVTGLGSGAVGFYKDGDRRYRLLALQRADAEQAKDVMKTLKARPGSVVVPPASGDESLHVVTQANPDAAKVEWLFTRKGALVAAVGDEETLIHPTDAPDVQAKVRVTKDEAIAKLKDWLAGSPPPAPSK